MTDFIRFFIAGNTCTDLDVRIASLVSKIVEREGRPAHNIILHSPTNRLSEVISLSHKLGTGYSCDAVSDPDYFLGTEKTPIAKQMARRKVPRHIVKA